MIPLRTWLQESGAQRDVIDGLASFADDWEAMWNGCPRGDWLLGIAERLGVDHDRASEILKVVAAVIAQSISPGQVRDIQGQLPPDLRVIFPLTEEPAA